MAIRSHPHERRCRGYDYNRIAELIDPELVIEALAQVYDDVDAFAKHTGGSPYDLQPAERAAKSFIRLHRKAQQSTVGKNGTVEDVAEDSETLLADSDD